VVVRLVRAAVAIACLYVPLPAGSRWSQSVLIGKHKGMSALPHGTISNANPVTTSTTAAKTTTFFIASIAPFAFATGHYCLPTVSCSGSSLKVSLSILPVNLNGTS
jgi:hypothetical protein